MRHISKCFNFKRYLCSSVISLMLLAPVTYAATDAQQSWLDASFAANNTFIFNPKTVSWKAVDADGRVIRSGRASGGRHYCPDVKRSCRTPTGTYRVVSKGGKSCRSSRYPLGKGGAPMPYCMFFNKNYAVHGSYDVPKHNASHGCIRVQPDAARWLSTEFMRIGTRVVVHPY